MARAISLEQGKTFQMGKGDSRRLISSEIGAQAITMNYSIFQPGHEFPQHIHDISADIFIVLEGGVSVRQGDDYTPIAAGDLAYIPPGEVHGTVNRTDGRAILISFQAPPDLVMYRGERDPSVTGSVPKPPPGHVSRVQIRRLAAGVPEANAGASVWTPVADVAEMGLSYYELAPGGRLSLPALSQAETVWFVWSGELGLEAGGEILVLPRHGAAFVPPGEGQVVENGGQETARLIRCQAPLPPA